MGKSKGNRPGDAVVASITHALAEVPPWYIEHLRYLQRSDRMINVDGVLNHSPKTPVKVTDALRVRDVHLHTRASILSKVRLGVHQYSTWTTSREGVDTAISHWIEDLWAAYGKPPAYRKKMARGWGVRTESHQYILYRECTVGVMSDTDTGLSAGWVDADTTIKQLSALRGKYPAQERAYSVEFVLPRVVDAVALLDKLRAFTRASDDVLDTVATAVLPSRHYLPHQSAWATPDWYVGVAVHHVVLAAARHWASEFVVERPFPFICVTSDDT